MGGYLVIDSPIRENLFRRCTDELCRMNMIPEVYRRSTENRQAQRVLRQRAFYVSAMTALKNRVHAFLAQQREEVREVVARETNIFSEKGQTVLLGLAPPRDKNRGVKGICGEAL